MYSYGGRWRSWRNRRFIINITRANYIHCLGQGKGTTAAETGGAGQALRGFRILAAGGGEVVSRREIVPAGLPQARHLADEFEIRIGSVMVGYFRPFPYISCITVYKKLKGFFCIICFK